MGSQMAPVQTADKGAHPIAAPREERRIPFRTENREHASEERGRSRKRRRGGDDRERCNDEEGNNSGTAEGSPTGGTPRKRRRSRKGLDKKFDCPHENCGKSYSRAEHLYRHQLNHSPKTLYYCDFPDCSRVFVRQDLCTRHRDRHTARGSQLQRKDVFPQPASIRSPPSNVGAKRASISAAAAAADPGERSSNADMTTIPNRKNSAPDQPNAHPAPAPRRVASRSSVTSSMTPAATGLSNAPAAIDPQLQSSSQYVHENSSVVPIPLHRSSSDGNYRTEPAIRSYESPGSSRTVSVGTLNGMQRHASFGSMDALRYATPANDRVEFTHPSQQTPLGPPSGRSVPQPAPYNHVVPQAYAGQQGAGMPGSSHGTYMAHHHFPPLSSLPPPGFPTMSQTPSSDSTFATSPPTSLSSIDQTPGLPMNRPVSEATLMDQMAGSYTMPVFGGEGYNRSPFAMADDFTAWLFNDPHFGNGSSAGRQAMSGTVPGFVDGSGAQFQAPFFQSPISVDTSHIPAIPAQHPMAVTSIVDTSPPETILSEEKRQELLYLIEMRFNETSHAPVVKNKASLLEGDREEDSHVLSLRMMQKYIASYWCHFHPQMPILHKPTFAADKAQNLLLLAIMALGASSLNKPHGVSLTQACSELASFLAWHLRWEVFMDSDFSPPAKLWIFQTLLLLEVYEKMYSTRALHERAHIHHATTLTLMRRGSSLLGRSALDSPPSVRDDKHGHSANSSSHASGTTTPDEWWNHWIINEATRRAAFAAFVVDSIHATMFGHSAVMVAHEMRLPLPCDEALWSATSSAEVGRVESNLHNNGIKPTTFLEGLKKTLNGQNVRTNSFGRTILMSGLLSVSWHMNQRDLQIHTLGVTQTLGGRDRWRGPLTRAFDVWRRDFDETLAQSPQALQQLNPTPYTFSTKMDEENVFEGRTVLHHLAHMAMHVDIVDCQIFARANRLLGRSITPQDYHGAQRRMKVAWAPTARARDATFYALRFLSHVLIIDEGSPYHQQPIGTAVISTVGGGLEYSARDDSLLNRPWVLYFAALIVWSYGYALDGPISPPVPALQTSAQMVPDMRRFLERTASLTTPDDLSSFPGRNECLGVLMVLRETFRKTRWELLHEAANLLTNCVELLTGTG